MRKLNIALNVVAIVALFIACLPITVPFWIAILSLELLVLTLTFLSSFILQLADGLRAALAILGAPPLKLSKAILARQRKFQNDQ